MTAIYKIACVSFRFLCVWRLRNTKVQSLMKELSAVYPIRTLHEMYEATVEAPRSFWFVNLVAKDKREMFNVQLDRQIVVD